ncbi:hypothetical protein EMIHUDRAFT_96056 [Emiliania huxleyi CCMP1516]|uniref:F-box domain-containing protein n=2 Tax=Emiliania huxleyi TaxID=2903 RepID=A0A0D3J470_EMIH1|nr:hypothetical protein EMIHUDRAFT_96056 [Emiliania huxleyi CCMP1516]EOD18305.1 hypothetical protein EMIHUDRAFT_96056 [Emiliania huxleyi CCMP1516]|eukprot:XP_005770734.1 hypothetical protein EMIHUDRAFT_96056 [Emiliania huxleyi CCMP1516]
MGASQSRPAPDACTASPLTPPPPPFPPPPSPSLLGLPAELLVCICTRLDIEALSSLASTSQELRDTIPDSLWQTHLDRLARAGGVAEEDVAAAGRRITNSIQRQAAIQAAAEAAEAAAFKSALTSLLASSDSCRLRVGLVRSMAMPSGAIYFTCIKRGVCRTLVFSSDLHGGSLATMLRRAAASGTAASALVVTLRESEGEGEEEEGSGGAGGAGGGEEAPPRSILSPLALRDISRQARRHVPGRPPPFTIGAFCPTPWPRTPNQRSASFGDASSFLFSLTPRARVYPAASRSAGCFRVSGESGIGIGGDAILRTTTG